MGAARRSQGKLPSVDWDLNVGGAAPQPIEAKVISTADDAFVVYQGETYQVGRDKISGLQLGAGGPSQTSRRSPSTSPTRASRSTSPPPTASRAGSRPA